jgi:hypothetical protein
MNQRNYTIISLLRGNNFTAVNNDLMAAIGALEAVVLSKILSYADYYYKNNLVDEEGWFKYPKSEIQKQTNTGEIAINTAVKKLIDCNLVEYRNKGLPASGHFRLSEELEIRICDLLQPVSAIKFSLPDIKELDTGNQGTVTLKSRNSNPEIKEHIYKESIRNNKKECEKETHNEILRQTAEAAMIDYEKLVTGIDDEMLRLMILENIEFNKTFKPIKLIQYLKGKTMTRQPTSKETKQSYTIANEVHDVF